MSLRRRQGKTVTGTKRSSKPGGRDPAIYCCAAHTLAARLIRENRRKRDERAKDKAAKTSKGKHK
jgi:hypothetical protein